MKYIIRFEIAPERRVEKGAIYTHGVVREGRLTLGAYADGSMMKMMPYGLREATRFSSYETATKALLGWAQRAATAGPMWAGNPSIQGVDE